MPRGQTLLDGALNGKVETEDCTWCLVNGGTELNVMLTKQNAAGPDVELVTFRWQLMKQYMNQWRLSVATRNVQKV